MDLNNALVTNSLMESITSMSEYFVAANTRTSFTDLVSESGPLTSISSTPNSSTSHLGHSATQQFSTATNASPSSSPLDSPPIVESNKLQINYTSGGIDSDRGDNHHPQHHHSLHLQNHHNQQQSNHHNHTTSSSNSMPNLHSTSFNQNHHHQIQDDIGGHPGDLMHNIQSPPRSSQPTRTQIPIHCYIEQLDACADIPSYQSPLNDNDLFATSNSHHHNNGNRSSQANTMHHHRHSQPPLLQSKLALESVTNCNDSSNGLASLEASTNNLYNDRDVASAAPNNSMQNISNNITNSDRSNNNPDIDVNDLDGLDANLDHLNSSSPLRSNFNNIQTTSNRAVMMHNHKASPSLGNHHNFQSRRETYAIVTSNELYIDLVRTVLLQLGYSAMDLINAKATIQIKNWKALALDQVTEDKRATVGEVLGDISTFVTLRIRLYRMLAVIRMIQRVKLLPNSCSKE